VGEEKKAITVHAEVIAKQSPALNALINGNMVEAKTGETPFDDVLEDTFVRFCQFAYTGDYETPSFTLTAAVSPSHGTSSQASSTTSDRADLAIEQVEDALSVIEVADPDAVPEGSESYDSICTFEGKMSQRGDLRNRKSASKSRMLRREMDRRDYDIEAARAITTAICEIRENDIVEEDYTPVFLGHARLYVLAEKWGIEALKILTLHKLHRTLVTFTLYKVRRGDIVELANFAYSNENTPDLEDDVDALRALVIHYITCELESLIEAPEFLALLEQGGLFSRDLVRMMMRRIE
jgi:hypothetical protein